MCIPKSTKLWTARPNIAVGPLLMAQLPRILSFVRGMKAAEPNFYPKKSTGDQGSNRLRGILFDGASGSITKSTITNITQVGASPCGDEGNAIEVRNFGASATTYRVKIDANTATGYQKGRITEILMR
jgi:hypothetical protein